jgi:hypothetical protein
MSDRVGASDDAAIRGRLYGGLRAHKAIAWRANQVNLAECRVAHAALAARKRLRAN